VQHKIFCNSLCIRKCTAAYGGGVGVLLTYIIRHRVLSLRKIPTIKHLHRQHNTRVTQKTYRRTPASQLMTQTIC